ncbi:Hypothetical protein UVM_LOCUS275 [uncultured virus]|nr:Hypothetical protein UVM_LOCUS275 [uncultured virus]
MAGEEALKRKRPETTDVDDFEGGADDVHDVDEGERESMAVQPRDEHVVVGLRTLPSGRRLLSICGGPVINERRIPGLTSGDVEVVRGLSEAWIAEGSPPERSLATKRPRIAAEWNVDMNSDRAPERVFWLRPLMASWICRDCRGQWEANVTSRVLGFACPHCSKRRKNAGTSQAEQRLVECLRLLLDLPEGEDLQARYPFYDGLTNECTMLRPDVWLQAGRHGVLRDVFVEYDSGMHRDSAERDRAKTELLLLQSQRRSATGDAGSALVVRLREAHLPSLVAPNADILTSSCYVELAVRVLHETHCNVLKVARDLLSCVTKHVPIDDATATGQIMMLLAVSPKRSWFDA